MAFFNKVQQKTREIADSAKLSSTISEEEKKINRIYTEIGKRYYAAHALDEVPEFPEQMSAISASRQKIKDCQDQLQKLRSVARCNVCGAEVPGSSAFCPSCGSPMNAASAYVGNCSKCGNPLLSGVRFCTRCGTPVSAAPAAPVTPVYQPQPAAYEPPAYPPEPAAFESPAYQPEPEPAAYEPPAYQPEPAYDAPAPQVDDLPYAPAPAEQVSRCPQCGAELEPDSVFCTNCGTRVQD